MTPNSSLVIPPDFEDLLKALARAAQIQRPLSLHDQVLGDALVSMSLATVSGRGLVATNRLNDMLKFAGASQVIAAMLLSPAVDPPRKPSFEIVEPNALEPSPPSPPSEQPGVPGIESSSPLPPRLKRELMLSQAEAEILRHAQFLGVAVDSLQKELDKMLELLRPRFELLDNPDQLIEITRTLPPGVLRSSLEDKAAKK